MHWYALRYPFAIALLTVATIACQPPAEAPQPEPAEPATTAPPVVEIRTTDYAFHAPSKLASGWTTLQMTNEGQEPHFVVFWLLPEDKTYDDYVQEVFDPFTELVARYKAGDLGRDEMLGQLDEALPEWLDMAGMGWGGVGLTSPGRSAVSIVNLPPGDYVLECYMVNAEGQLHNELGMLRPLEVTDETTGAEPPEADVELAISNEGLAVDGQLGPGEHTVKVTVTETPAGLLGHDIHLARLGEDTRLETVTSWMSWVDGLTPPAPAEFLGGAEQVPPGEASYVRVVLEPGRYAWISEGYAPQGVMHEFRAE